MHWLVPPCHTCQNMTVQTECCCHKSYLCSSRIHKCICRYFNGIYKYLRAAKEGREKLHSHLVQPDSLGIALLAVASSSQLCTQASTAAMVVLPPGDFTPKVWLFADRQAALECCHCRGLALPPRRNAM